MPKLRGKTMLTWAVLILVGLGAAGIAYFFFWVNTSKNAMVEAIQKNPATTAIAAYTIDEQGELVEDGQSIFYNADMPLVVGSTMKVVVLAAYEQAVAQGELAPNEKVPVADLESFYLPGTDGGAHAAGMSSLGLRADPSGFSSDPQAWIKLDDIARFMISYSGNAETDYLMERLGAGKIAAALQAAGFKHHARIQPILGISLAIFNHEQPILTAGQRQTLVEAVNREDLAVMEHLADQYRHNPDWRTAQIQWMQSAAFLTTAGQMTWDDQLQASQLFPKGTARENAHLMAKIASGNLYTPEASARMQQKLEAVPTDWPLRLLFYQHYGAKDGVTAGVLALASYAIPKSGPLAGRSRVGVVLTNDLPLDTWSAQVRDQGIYLLQTDLVSACGAFEKLRNVPVTSLY